MRKWEGNKLLNFLSEKRESGVRDLLNGHGANTLNILFWKHLAWKMIFNILASTLDSNWNNWLDGKVN